MRQFKHSCLETRKFRFSSLMGQASCCSKYFDPWPWEIRHPGYFYYLGPGITTSIMGIFSSKWQRPSNNMGTDTYDLSLGDICSLWFLVLSLSYCTLTDGGIKYCIYDGSFQMWSGQGREQGRHYLFFLDLLCGCFGWAIEHKCWLPYCLICTASHMGFVRLSFFAFHLCR